MKRERKDHLLLVFFILLVFLILYAVYFIFGLLIPQKAARDFGQPDPQLEISRRILYAVNLEANKKTLTLPLGGDGVDRLFTIQYGESASQVAHDLYQSGLIRAYTPFINLLIYSGNDKKIQAGIYTLSPAMSMLDIANHIIDSNPQDVAFSFLPGWRSEEIAALLPQSGLAVDAADFLSEVKKPAGDYKIVESSGAGSLEGFLFPGEYQMLRSAGAQDLAAALTGQFAAQLPAEYTGLVEKKGLSLYESIILASIVQKEMVVMDEGPLIAGVFLNRLKAGMPLQSDPTVQYALGYDEQSATWWKNPLSAEDLQTASPYNTYLNAGLPPAPICNPGMTALMAVANAMDTPYLYFRAACDGSGRHVFSATYEEHLAAACQ
jgi:UPF0755 protein